MSSISFGVAALVAIDSFSANVTASVHDQSRALMGGDISITSRVGYAAPVESTLVKLRQERGIVTARQVNFPSMVVYQPLLTTRLVDVRAISAGYPLFGVITTEPASAWNQLHAGNNIVV